MHVVLEGYGHACQGAELLARSAAAVRLGGSGKGKVRRDLQECLDLLVTCFDGVEGGLGHLGCAELPRGHAGSDARGGELVDVGH